LLIRYRRSEDGRPVAKAIVYTHAEHRIERSQLDPDALRIVERLRAEGHEAYIVGGAVRDMLLGRSPKDFDIVTSAEPARIKRIFRSARVIGRRFRLVHVYAGSKIFEVSTFRSIANGTIGNEYGTMDEDALRRDFTLNALYFDPHDSTLVDYVGGFKDMAAKRIRPVIALKTIFKEDPVRMIRCVKYAAMAGFRIPFSLRMALRRDSQLLATASPSRLTEEFLKILASGSSAAILKGLGEFDLLRHIAPASAALAASVASYKSALVIALAELDAEASDPAREKRLALLLAHYLKPYLETRPERFVDTPEAYREAVHEARLFLAPLNPPRVELEAAVLVVFKRRGVSPLQKPKRPGGDRASRPGERRSAGRNDEIAQKTEASAETSEAVKRRRRRPRRRKISGGGGPGGESPKSPNVD
jgi:poly(A) polymerase